MKTQTDFTPIFIRPESEIDVVMITDRPETQDANPTPNSYSVESGSADFDYFNNLIKLFDEVDVTLSKH